MRKCDSRPCSDRDHHGLDNKLIAGKYPQRRGEIECHERLGGLHKYYQRAA